MIPSLYHKIIENTHSTKCPHPGDLAPTHKLEVLEKHGSSYIRAFQRPNQRPAAKSQPSPHILYATLATYRPGESSYTPYTLQHPRSLVRGFVIRLKTCL